MKSPAALGVVLLEPHVVALRSLLQRDDGSEASAYLLFGRADISADPWSRLPRTRLISHEIVPVAADEMVSASPVHVTWSTRGFMRVLGAAKERAHVASDTELLEIALSRLVLEDDFGRRFVRRKGKIPKSVDLEF